MKTIKNHRKSQAWSGERLPRDRFVRDEAMEAPIVRDTPRVSPNLIESDEYEWTTAVNLPGLLVSPTNAEHLAPAAPIPRRTTSEIIESEDGDVVGPCQLPGGLAQCETAAFAPFALGRAIDACNGVDEYTEAAAMQLPGALVARAIGAADPVPVVRGLCATCVHNASCDFPRPAGGVWRCEEYA